MGPERLDGGRSADLFRIRLASGPADVRERDLVLRQSAPQRSFATESAIQDYVARRGHPAPAVVRSGIVDDSWRYLIMGFVEGESLFDSLGPVSAIRRVPACLAELMAALHRIDPDPLHRDLGTGDLLDGTARCRADVEQCLASIADRRVEALRDWFDVHAPEPGRTVVCHGDLHALDVLVGAETAVVDWELATLADPAFDIARTKLLLHAVPMDVPAPVRPTRQRLGRRAAARFER